MSGESTQVPQVPDSRMVIGETDFLLDGEPLRILSGALHYFRVHPDLWADRIHKARLMGLNTIETYVPWNAHAPRRGEFRTDGGLDLERFLRLVEAEGMHAIVRPGPYICAEWDNGGLPGWLFRDPAVGVRRDEPLYMEAVSEYLGTVLNLVAPFQVDRGGPVVLVQVENEYGAYGSDHVYLDKLVALTRSHGITVPLTSIDQPSGTMLADGSVDALHSTGSFGSRSAERLATLREHQPTGPLMCAEFWDGWFDHWGAHHHTTSAEDAARELDELLAAGASVNIYMFHGGTNFGFTSGANDKGVYQPTTTSYDYDAPLAEDGTPTAKFFAFRDVIARYAPVPDEALPERVPAPTPAVDLEFSLSALDAAEGLGSWTASEHVPTTDEVDSYTGFALYRTTLAAAQQRVLSVGEVRDRAQAMLDGSAVGTLDRSRHERTLSLPGGPEGVLTFLVEDQGRVNYGPRLGEHKGIIGPVTVGGTEVTGWEVLPLDLDDVGPLTEDVRAHGGPVVKGGAVLGPSFVAGSFEVDEPADLFLDAARLGKGVVWVNGFNLGRYWSAGPQQTLYVPAPVVVAGRNTVLVLTLDGLDEAPVFVPGLDLGHEEQ